MVLVRKIQIAELKENASTENVIVHHRHNAFTVHPAAATKTAPGNGVRVENVIVLLLRAWREPRARMPRSANREDPALTENAIVKAEVAKTMPPA